MKLKELILQGVTPRTHGDVVREMLSLSEVQRVILGTAFVTEGGVNEIADALDLQAAVTCIYAGVRNGVTTRQGLDRLFELGLVLKVVDTGSVAPIYHPKMLYVRTAAVTMLLSGSSNLTLGGLHNNIEGSLLLQVDAGDVEALARCAEFEAAFDGLEAAYPVNVRTIADAADLSGMSAAGILIDEDTAPPGRTGVMSASPGTPPYVVPRMKMSLAPKRRPRRKAVIVQAPPPSATNAGPTPAGSKFEVVWESGPLTLRDLNIPEGEKSNATGSINLDKGAFGKTIDQRHYFREKVFAALNWPAVSAKVDAAPASFDIVVRGVDCGTYVLMVRHTTSVTSKSYVQDNAMTRLSWGKAKNYVQDLNLKDATLTLSRNVADPTRFMIDIS